MDYYINSAVFSSAFTFPTAVVDKHLKFANPSHIIVLLYIMRNIANEISVDAIEMATGISEYDINEALIYWAEAGILAKRENEKSKNEQIKPKSVVKESKPNRLDIAKRGDEDIKIRFLLNETQMKLGRNLKSNEASTLVWLYDDAGLDVSLIMLIVQYAVQHNRANIRFIESVAVDWINRGIESVTEADEELKKMAQQEQAWFTVCSVFGLEKRKPSKKEEELSFKWIENWKLSKETLKQAYDACVDAKSKLSFGYIAKILENWHNNPEASKSNKSSYKNNGNSPAYDLDLFEKMLSSKD